MKKSLKILSLIISLLIIMQSVPSFAQSGQTLPNTYATSETSENIEALLTKLGIVKDAGAPEDVVFKAQYIEYLVNMLQISMVPASEQIFFDVPLTSAYADVVNTAYTVGITKGNMDGTLSIDTPITFNEAVVMAVRALGATIFLPEDNSSYASYLSVAKKLDLLDKVKITEAGTLNRGNVIRLLFNALNADSIATNDGRTYYLDDVSMLENYYNIYTANGVIESCQYGDIYGGNTQKKDIVTIDGTNYKFDSVAAKELLGHRVTFYYTESSLDTTNEIVFMYSNGTEITEIDVEDVEYHKQGKLEYIDIKGKTDDVKLSDTALTLVNGKRISLSNTGMVLPKHGVVSLIDNDSDGRYDIIHYHEYSISLASNINVAEEKVYSYKGDYKVIELGDYETYYIYDTQGNSLPLSSITKDTLLNISENGYKTVMEITVCTDVADFDIASMRTENEDGVTIYYFEDTEKNEYRTVSDFADIYDKNKIITSAVKKNDKTNEETIDFASIMSNKYVFALNSDGKIAAVLERKESDNYMFGYIIDIYKDEVRLSGDIQVRMLTTTDGVVDYSLADKVSVIKDSQSNKLKKSDVPLSIGVVRYRLNSEDKVISVEFPGTAENGFRQDKTLPTGSTDNTRYYSGNKLIGGTIVVNNDTKVFYVPGADHKHDVEWYYAVTGASLVNMKYYPSAVSYKYDDDVYADIIVASSSDSGGSGMMLVEKLVKVYDEKTGTSCDAIKGYVNGTLLSYAIDSSSPYPVHSKTPNFRAAPGDVIRFSTNPLGYIGNIYPVLDVSEGKVYNYNMSSTVRYPFGNGECQVYGQMNDIYDGKFMNLICDDEKYKDYYYCITSGTRIYQFDADEKKGVIKVITASDIPTLNSGTCTDEHTLIVTSDSSTELVVVYK